MKGTYMAKENLERNKKYLDVIADVGHPTVFESLYRI